MKNATLLAWMLLSHAVFAQKTYDYPVAPKDATVDVYFGEEVADPYQWMENPSDPKLATWLAEEQAFTDKIANRQTHVFELQRQIMSVMNSYNSEDYGAFVDEDKLTKDKYEFDEYEFNFGKSPDLRYRERGTLGYKYLIRARDFLKTKEERLDYAGLVVNDEEDLALVTISINGSDWTTGYLFDLKTGTQLPYTLKNLWGNAGWYKKSLYFSGYDDPEKGRELLDQRHGQKLYKLTVGQDTVPQLLFTNVDASGTNNFKFSIIDNKLFLFHFIRSAGAIYRTMACASLDALNFFPRTFLVFPNDEHIQLKVSWISNDSVWIETNWNAPNGKVLLANVNQPNQVQEFVPEYDILLDRVNPLGKNKLACIYFHNGSNTAIIYNHQGELLKKIDFPPGKRLVGLWEYEDLSTPILSFIPFTIRL